MCGERAFTIALVPQQAAGGLDDEVALAAPDQFDIDFGAGFPDCGGQTGRLGFVVSDHAVFDRHLHGRKSGR